MLLPFLRSFQPPDPKTNDAIPNIPLALSVPLSFFLGSACSLPKYTTVSSEQPPDYYLGESPEVSVVNAEGATRRMQDIAIQELRTQSRSNGHFTIEN